MPETQTKRRRAPAQNGAAQTTEQEGLAAALAYEQRLGEDAAKIRGDAPTLTVPLLMQLRELLCKPIPTAYIEHIGVVTGKPYESTGIRSVQVQIDRMNNVLGPAWWRDDVEYTDDGKVAHVTVLVGNPGEPPLVRRSSAGGVDRGSTKGNVFKGSYTNAAKLAFARVGPGHEVYVGAADLDPDVDEATAKAQQPTGPAEDAPIDKDRVTKLLAAFSVSGVSEKTFRTKLAQVGVTNNADIDVAVKALTYKQALEIYTWLSDQARGQS